MREIKFRATLQGKIVCYIRLRQNSDGFIEQTWNHTGRGGWCFGEPPRHDNRDLHTGLKDKNNFEIYEGDIVRYTYPKRFSAKENIGQVMYAPPERNRAAFIIEYPKGGFDDLIPHDVLDDTATLEVIGNIHQNPDLLS